MEVALEQSREREQSPVELEFEYADCARRVLLRRCRIGTQTLDFGFHVEGRPLDSSGSSADMVSSGSETDLQCRFTGGMSLIVMGVGKLEAFLGECRVQLFPTTLGKTASDFEKPLLGPPPNWNGLSGSIAPLLGALTPPDRVVCIAERVFLVVFLSCKSKTVTWVASACFALCSELLDLRSRRVRAPERWDVNL